jgi:lipopolysaccharide transport system permease protein
MRYKQTIIGVAWAVLRPFLTMVVFTVIFGRVAGLPSDGKAPYALLVFAGMLPWTLFSTALSESSNSLVGNANLISKVYFPRLIVPAAAVVTAFVEFLISSVILLGLLAYYQFVPGWNMLLLPLFVILALLVSLGPWPVDHCAQREISRFPLCDPLHCAIWPVYLPGRLQQSGHLGAMAAPLRP